MCSTIDSLLHYFIICFLRISGRLGYNQLRGRGSRFHQGGRLATTTIRSISHALELPWQSKFVSNCAGTVKCCTQASATTVPNFCSYKRNGKYRSSVFGSCGPKCRAGDWGLLCFARLLKAKSLIIASKPIYFAPEICVTFGGTLFLEGGNSRMGIESTKFWSIKT